MRQKMLSEVELHVYISCWMADDLSSADKSKKFRQLTNLMLELSRIRSASLSVHLYTNLDSEIWRDVAAPLFARINSEFLIHNVSRQDLTVTDKKLYIPWLLTWQHKKQMRLDVLAGNDNSVFLYLEDDAIFTDDNLNYFLEFRPILDKVGLIPGFVRAEWSDLHLKWIHPDSFSDDANEPLFQISGCEYKLMQRKNPYSALIILDKELGNEYVNSESFEQQKACFKHPIIYDIGSTAALGLISENVPEGFINRMASPVLSSGINPLISSIVRHQGDKYANDIWQKHYVLFGDDAGKRISEKRTIQDKARRMLRKDFLNVGLNFLRKRK